MAAMQAEQLITQTRDLTLSSELSENDAGESSPGPTYAPAEPVAIDAVVAAAQQVLETASPKGPRTESVKGRNSSTGNEPPATAEQASASLPDLPNEVLMHILSFLDVNDLLSTSRVSVPTCVSAKRCSIVSFFRGLTCLG